MKRIILIILIAIGLQNNTISQTTYKIPKDTKRIIFLGNSITYAGEYVSFIETLLKISDPNRNIECINLGLPSETVSGLSEKNHAGGRFPRPDLHERLERILNLTKPDLVIACYGMNDGIYKPLSNNRLQKFKDGINWLNKEVLKHGAKIIFLTPPIFDEKHGEKYAHVLDVYSNWLIECRSKQKWEVIDIHYPMKKILAKMRIKDSTFVLASDGIHPGRLGHWIIAKQVLQYLGIKNITNYKNIDQALNNIANGKSMLQLIENRQSIMKHAWLTATKYKRPGIEAGIPLSEATKISKKIESKIQTLLK